MQWENEGVLERPEELNLAEWDKITIIIIKSLSFQDTDIDGYLKNGVLNSPVTNI